jgi:hypothetical protein
MKYPLTILALAIITNSAFAGSELMYNSKPVHPTCLEKLQNETRAGAEVALSSCVKNSKKTSVRDGYYTTEDDNNPKQTEFTSYAVIGKKGDNYLIVVATSTGGSGLFTDALWVKMKDGTLTLLKSLAGGDRCNGGVEKVADWKYSINLTPSEMMTYGSGAPLKIDAYRDLDASASSCVAKAMYRFDPVNEKAELINVQLGSEPLAMEDWLKELRFQFCFNNLYNTYIARGQITLNETEMDHFKNQFENFCISQPTS